MTRGTEGILPTKKLTDKRHVVVVVVIKQELKALIYPNKTLQMHHDDTATFLPTIGAWEGRVRGVS